LLEKKKNKSPAKKSGEARKAKGQKGRGLGGEGPEYQSEAWYGVKIFALLRLRIERFRFSLIKRKPKRTSLFWILFKKS
jgi:hypothetical protein